jgi:hypothetical protein
LSILIFVGTLGSALCMGTAGATGPAPSIEAVDMGEPRHRVGLSVPNVLPIIDLFRHGEIAWSLPRSCTGTRRKPPPSGY